MFNTLLFICDIIILSDCSPAVPEKLSILYQLFSHRDEKEPVLFISSLNMKIRHCGHIIVFWGRVMRRVGLFVLDYLGGESCFTYDFVSDKHIALH